MRSDCDPGSDVLTDSEDGTSERTLIPAGDGK